MAHDDDDWFTCPNCGEVVTQGASACPHCGADDETGWSQMAMYDDLGLDDAAFGEEPARPTRQSSKRFAYIVIALVIVIFLVWVIAGL